MRRRLRHLAVLVLLLSATGAPSATAQQQLRPGACTSTAEPGDNWAVFANTGLGLSLRLPAGLTPVKYESLRGMAQRAAKRSIPSTPSSSAELVLAWEARGKSPGALDEVLLYSIGPDSLPEGRPCALRISGRPGYVFKMAFAGRKASTSEYRIEAYWPGFMLVATGPSLEAYEAALAILRSIASLPEVRRP